MDPSDFSDLPSIALPPKRKLETPRRSFAFTAGRLKQGEAKRKPVHMTKKIDSQSKLSRIIPLPVRPTRLSRTSRLSPPPKSPSPTPAPPPSPPPLFNPGTIPLRSPPPISDTSQPIKDPRGYYRILGLTPNLRYLDISADQAITTVIRTSYLKRLRELHPDRVNGSLIKTQELNHARDSVRTG